MLGKRFARFRQERAKDSEQSASEALENACLDDFLRVLPQPKLAFGDLFTKGEAKSKVYRTRFEILQRKLSRHEQLYQSGQGKGATPAIAPNVSAPTSKIFSSQRRITPIGTLRGRAAGPCLVFGMLSSMADSKLYLEDLDSRIEIVIDKETCITSAGYFAENSFVLIDGLYTLDRTLLARGIQCPPIEYASKSKRYVADSPASLNRRRTQTLDHVTLDALEKVNKDAFFVILSDVWLDQPSVIDRLRALFTGFAREDVLAPLAFIFMGNFSCTAYVYSAAQAKVYTESWNALADVLAEFPKLTKTCRFIFVPGPGDPTLSGGGGGRGTGYTTDNNVGAKDRYGLTLQGTRSAFGDEETATLPRSSIPLSLLGSKIQRVLGQSATFASNPCRIAYCTQEIVVFRQDLFSKLLRSSLFKTNGDFSERTHLHHTLLSQAHLSPLPLSSSPVYWKLDDELRISPLPDVLILGDRLEAYCDNYAQVQIINPGVLPLTDFSFLVYYPHQRQVELSHIPKN